jgi:hypothetical protein
LDFAKILVDELVVESNIREENSNGDVEEPLNGVTLGLQSIISESLIPSTDFSFPYMSLS